MYIKLHVHFIRICIITICLIIVIQGSNFSTFPKNRRRVKIRRPTVCSSSQFRCSSGQCVTEDAVCNGQIDCNDGSDESDCSSLTCPSTLFQCTYGACIRKKLMCDGKQDCKDNSDETSPFCGNLVSARYRAPDICRKGEFKCDSGQCLNEEFLCDGKANCLDGSDETPKKCSAIPCPPPSLFRCDYGACVSKLAKCNGVNDCRDGSDEKNCTGQVIPVTVSTKPRTTTPTVSTEPSTTTPTVSTKPTTTTPTKPTPISKTPTPTNKSTGTPAPAFCKIPNYPSNGMYEVGARADLKPGQYVPPFSALFTKCNNLYKVDPTIKNMFSLCIKGAWVPAPLTCERACSPIPSNPTTKAKCKYKGVSLSDCENPVEGTIVTLECEPLYEIPGISTKPSRACRDGTWSYYIPQCQPVCGQKTPRAIPNVFGGQIAKQSDYPWHVGVYEMDDEYVCGGSVINLKVVLSAAHCFTNPQADLQSPDNFKIAGGKHYRNYTDPRDMNPQFSFIKEIYIPERYKGSVSQYEADLAVVILETSFKLTLTVQPVCFDRANDFEYQQLTGNNVGVAIGWGYVDYDGNLSDELKEIYVPYRSYRDCYGNVTTEFKKFLTHDKICAGYLYENKSICRGDSGGGLVFQRDENRYFIRGIVSVSSSSSLTGVPTCDPRSYATYTLISKHLSFVTEIELLNEI